VRLGEQPASKVVNQWLDAAPARQLLVHRSGRLVDPGHVVEVVVTAEPGAACRALADALADGWPRPEGWLDDWSVVEATTRAVLTDGLDQQGDPTEPAVARSLAALLPDGGTLAVSSSMPIRDVEWFAEPRTGLRVLANRGANGIDGVTSTAVGVALGTGGPTALLIGDVAFLHDTNGLLGLAGRDLALTVVVVDNDGGGIFSFLPQRASLPGDRFERLFGTPHGVDLAALASAHGLPVTEVTSMPDLERTISSSVAGGGVQVVVVRTDRDANVQVHEELIARVAAALG
jgi:2-succinyl-5-enolpyruvyl-6-hydroxy-3-cyclohexene-1-carboxylate synthase